ncbi:unnamed protein product [Ilex paraguariensis]|uniref:Uncharacterized protein n=1 Tax=Ilex paraguariensis TaxID=185542 RepID=A0ABC8TB75_9AQUA
MPDSTLKFSEPDFAEYASYYLAWYDSSYGGGSPYGEPLPSPPEGLADMDREVDFTGRLWNDNRLTEQAYEEIEQPYNISDNWLESYFDGGWGEDMFSCGYGAFDNEHGPYGSALENAEDPYQGEEQFDGYYSYDDDTEMQTSYDYNPWFGYCLEFGYGVDEDYCGNDVKELEVAQNFGFDEMRLCERIFGHWPSLSSRDLESYA